MRQLEFYNISPGKNESFCKEKSKQWKYKRSHDYCSIKSVFCLFCSMASWVWPEQLCQTLSNSDFPEKTHWIWVYSHFSVEGLDVKLSGLACLIPHCWNWAKLCFCGAGLVKLLGTVWDGGSGSSRWNAALGKACAKCLEIWNLRFWAVEPGCSWTESTQVWVSSEMRTCDVTFALDRPVFGRKNKIEAGFL